MNVTTRALHLADAAVALAKVSTTRADDIKLYDEALTVIREARAEQSIVLNDPHPPHRLCECTACLEYWTPLPDCDAFAGGGKPIDHIADTGKMIGCAYCDNPLFAGTKCNNCGRVTIAEPANTRSTSEYLEPVKQEPVMDYEYICALREGEQHQAEDSYFFVRPENDTPTSRKMFCQGFERGFHKGLKYAAPVSAKREWVDLTDEEIATVVHEMNGNEPTSPFWRDLIYEAIAAFKEKNK